jgi:hypothetical protein
VPTLIKAPGQTTGKVDDRNWQHVDLAPTVAQHAGMRVPWKVDGVSALGPPRTGTDKLFCDSPTARVNIDTSAGLPVITGTVTGFPKVAPQPRPELIGRPLGDFTVTDGVPGAGGGPAATVANRADFDRADPASGVPALVYGSVPDAVPAGTLLAIAVNGRVAAVVPVQARKGGTPRFAGMVADGSLFRAGRNDLELFVIDGDRTLRRLAR